MWHPMTDREESLASRRVRVLDPVRGMLECRECGARWLVPPHPREEGLPPGYWKCPNRCNCPDESREEEH